MKLHMKMTYETMKHETVNLHVTYEITYENYIWKYIWKLHVGITYENMKPGIQKRRTRVSSGIRDPGVNPVPQRSHLGET